MPAIKFYDHEPIPVEMHKVKIVQQLQLLPADQRLEKMKEAGFNTFQLHNGDIFMDMLTDSGVNAMSDQIRKAGKLRDHELSFHDGKSSYNQTRRSRGGARKGRGTGIAE